jgi:hypothetical protein
MEEATAAGSAGSAVGSVALLSSGGGLGLISGGGGASGEFAAVGSGGGEATSVEEKEKQRRKKEKKKKEKEEKRKEKEEKEKHKREKEREEKEKAKRDRKEEKEREKKERKSGLKSTSEPMLPQVLQHPSPQHGGPQAVPLTGSLPSTPVSSSQPQQATSAGQQQQQASPTSPSTQRRDRRNTDLFGDSFKIWRRSLAGKRDRSGGDGHHATSTLHQQTHSQPEERRGSTPPRPTAAAFQPPPLAHSASVQSMPAVRRVAMSAGAEKRLSKESPDVLQQTELRKFNAMRELGAESMQYIEKRRSMEVGSYGSLGRKTGLDAINNEFNSADPIRKHCTSFLPRLSTTPTHRLTACVPRVSCRACRATHQRVAQSNRLLVRIHRRERCPPCSWPLA